MTGAERHACGAHAALTLVSTLAALLILLVAPAHAQPGLAHYLDEVEPSAIMAEADAFGAIREDLPVAPLLADGRTVGWAFLNSAFATAVGYSGKPIHVVVGIDPAGVITGAVLVQHYEPIVLVGIPERRIAEVIAGYAGLDVTREVGPDAAGHEIDIVSGATVTVMVIDDSIVRGAVRVARALGLGGLEPEVARAGPERVIDRTIEAERDWLELLGEGSIRRLSLDVGMVNAAFAERGDPEAAARPAAGPDDATFIDLYAGLATLPVVCANALGARECQNLRAQVGEDGHAILVAGRGRYSFKGSGYVRGGVFDRITLIQGDRTIRFRDRDHKRLAAIAAAGAPRLDDVDLFRIPEDAEFEPTEPWRLQLLVSRDIGPVERDFLTFELGYQPPETYLRRVEPAATATSEATPQVGEAALGDDGHRPLWMRIWERRLVDVGILGAALIGLTAAFFFQWQLVHHPRVHDWGRLVFLTFVLVWLGWWQGAQLSVVNVMTFTNALLTDFSWDYFLMDPLIFIQWCAVAAALLFWGRGAYCGWLCPFGALQELTNRLAKAVRIPQWEVPWGLHERLWPVKYILFLALLAVSLYSLDTAERLAEVEPFKTAIVLRFLRDWPFVVFAAVLLIAGLFVERFYCRYLCGLGAALAIPGRLRMFEWLKRYRECGNPCQICAKECPVQSIHPEGHINPNECIYCMHCQVVYVDDHKCPVRVRRRQKRERQQATTGGSAKPVLPTRVTASGVPVTPRGTHASTTRGG